MKLRPITLTLILAVAAIVWILIFVALQILWPDWRMVNENIHSAVEALGGMTAIVMAAFLLQRKREEYGGKLFLLAVGLLGMGVLDVLHATVSPGKGFVLLHSTASLVGGFWFALIFLPWCARNEDSTWKKAVPWLVVAASIGFGIWTYLDRQSLPAMTLDGRFTTTAVAFNVLAGAFFAASASRLLFDFYRFGKFEIYLYACIAALFGLAGVIFPYSALWDATWWLLHLLRFIAYALGLIYVVKEHYHAVVDLRVALTEREQTEEEIRQRNRELSVLYTIRRRAMQSLDLTKVLKDSLSATLEALEVEAGAVVLTDPDGEMMTIHVHSGLSEEFVRNTQRIKLGEGVTGKAVAEKKPVVLYISEYPTARLASFIIKEGFQTLASTPLMSAGQALGALTLGTRRARAFPPEELELLAGIGQLLGGAVQNAQLYEQVQRELAERKRAEEALRQAKEELETKVAERTVELRNANVQLRASSLYARSLIEASLDPLVTINPDGEITDVNEASVQATGVPREKLVGTDFSDYFTEPEKAREGYRQVFSKGFVRDYPLAIRHMSGRVTDVLYNAGVYKDEKEKVHGVFAAARDITAQKQASQYARSLIEASLDPLVTISPDGKITDVNEASAQATGVVREKLIGADFSDYFTEPEKAREGYQRVFSQGYVRDYPLTIRHVNGKVTDVLYNASVYKDDKGEDLGVFAAARDVTERKRAEEEIKKLNENLKHRAMELDAINKELETFSYSVAHDLRAPLRGIDGFSQVLLEDYSDRLDEKGKDNLRRVRAASQRMGQLIDALLNLSRLTRGKVYRESVDLSAVAKMITAELQRREPERRVEFLITEGVTVNGDPQMMQAVLENLLGNAWKFTGKHPTARIEFGVAQDEGKIGYYVRDDGAGFDMAYADKLFGAFQRLHATTEYPGIGIGLATVQRIIHRHGGRLWAKGAIEQGATFYFTLD